MCTLVGWPVDANLTAAYPKWPLVDVLNVVRGLGGLCVAKPLAFFAVGLGCIHLCLLRGAWRHEPCDAAIAAELIHEVRPIDVIRHLEIAALHNERQARRVGNDSR